MIRKGSTVWFRWSAADIQQVKFVRWHRMRMHTGAANTNKLGVGCVVESDWLFSKCIVGRIPRGVRRGQYILRPYTQLYPRYIDACGYRNEVKRPTVKKFKHKD